MPRTPHRCGLDLLVDLLVCTDVNVLNPKGDKRSPKEKCCLHEKRVFFSLLKVVSS